MIGLAMSLDLDPAGFFREFYEKVYRFVASGTGLPDQEIEDLVQETLLQAWRDREQFRTDSAALTWVLSIAKHRVFDYRRREQRVRQADAVLRALASLETEELPEHVLASEEAGRRVRRALEELEPDYAEVLLQRYRDGRSVQEIADAMGESRKAVESRLHRAREALRKALGERSQSHAG